MELGEEVGYKFLPQITITNVEDGYEYRVSLGTTSVALESRETADDDWEPLAFEADLDPYSSEVFGVRITDILAIASAVKACMAANGVLARSNKPTIELKV